MASRNPVWNAEGVAEAPFDCIACFDMALDRTAARHLPAQQASAPDETTLFERRWRPLARHTAAPAFSWEMIERQLLDLAGSPVQAALARPLVARLQALGSDAPPEMVLRELLCLASVLIEGT